MSKGTIEHMKESCHTDTLYRSEDVPIGCIPLRTSLNACLKLIPSEGHK
ncbi:MAG: hypothetical protein LUP99_04120 [Methanomicrobiales archaeon]|nr:hypothetical protein [Methanomicrobiales archaeon]